MISSRQPPAIPPPIGALLMVDVVLGDVTELVHFTAQNIIIALATENKQNMKRLE